MALAAEWSVSVDGIDVSDKMNDLIESIEVTAKAGGSADSAKLTFDDTDGAIILPPEKAEVEITIEGRVRFRGYVDGSPEMSGSRGGGQKLDLNCKGFDKSGKVKEAQRWHKDDATLQDFLDEAAEKAGLSGIKLDPAFAEIRRPFWSAKGRNFLQLGQALADEYGGTFKIRGDQAVLAKRGNGQSPGGSELPTITATKGDNLRTWRITPKSARPRFAKAKVRRYDRKQAKWIEETVEIGDALGGSDVSDILGTARPDEDSAKLAGEGRKTESEREGGEGSVTIDLNVDAEVEGTCILAGCREGADGEYRIESVTDKITREGSETSLELKQPKGEAGTDSRAKSSSSSSSSPQTPAQASFPPGGV